ncbi:hypothetical protein Tco_1358794, partial [Tanacetum coccineum]
NPEQVRLNVLTKLQEAIEEEAILEEQILALMHRFADRFTDRRVEINNLMVLHNHPLIDYEVEYIVASDASKEAVWVRKFIAGLGVVIEYGDVKLEKVHTDDNLADPFTKALAFPKHSEHTKNIGMLPASNLM